MTNEEKMWYEQSIEDVYAAIESDAEETDESLETLYATHDAIRLMNAINTLATRREGVMSIDESREIVAAAICDELGDSTIDMLDWVAGGAYHSVTGEDEARKQIANAAQLWRNTE